ncbi:unnamed protein product [Rhizopus stolonifer]
MQPNYYTYNPQLYMLSQQQGLNSTMPLNESMTGEGYESEASGIPDKRTGRRKIKIEYIHDKSRRHITFSKRKAGIMKKAYELSTLTGTQVLLLVVSETGLVYTFTTPKLQPLVTKSEGKNLIQSCLNAPDSMNTASSYEQTFFNAPSNQSSNHNSNNQPITENNTTKLSKETKVFDRNVSLHNAVPADNQILIRSNQQQMNTEFLPSMSYPTYADNSMYQYNDQNYWAKQHEKR